MRTTFSNQLALSQIPIEDISIDPDSRDDIPALLKGIQSIYLNEPLRQKIFDLLEDELLDKLGTDTDSPAKPDRKIDPTVGRPGMELWQILVLGLLKQGLGCDYDRLHELANQHCTLKRMLCLEDFWQIPVFKHRTIVRNVALLTPQLLAKINRLIVEAGHLLAGQAPEAPLQARCDSFVVETNVHFPTDVNLLWDAMRGLIRTVGRLANQYRLEGWRQWQHLILRLKKFFNRVRSSKQRKKNKERVQEYLEEAIALLDRAEATLRQLVARGIEAVKLQDAKEFEKHARRQIAQIDRRVLQGETIPHEEKVLSIFKPYTRWCVKGKAGVQVELGVPVCIVESEHQFVLNAKVMWQEADVDVATAMIEETQAGYPSLKRCSFDKGFHSRANQERLGEILELNTMPKKGRLSQADQEREGQPEFVAARRQHPAVESGIHNLECRGLDRVREYGERAFERMVWMSVVAANVHRIGLLLQRRERERRKAATRRRKAA